jgi:hypothetical protein
LPESPFDGPGASRPQAAAGTCPATVTAMALDPIVAAGLMSRAIDGIAARLSGPMRARLLIQPVTAAVLAIRAGILDANAGRPAYLWTLFSDPSARRALLRSGWADVGKIFVIAAIIDVAYQDLMLPRVYLRDALMTATLLAIAPYLALRGLTTRLWRRFVRS